jgi:hypothetical protein
MPNAPFDPTRLDKDSQDANYVPNEIDDTVKGGSALPGSAVNPVTGVQAPWQAQGFVGTRTVPGGEG